MMFWSRPDTYREVFNSLPIGAIIVEKKDNSFIVVDANRQASSQGGWKNLRLQDVIGKDICLSFPGIEDSGLLLIYQEVLQTQQPAYLGRFPYEDVNVPDTTFEVWVSPISPISILITYTRLDDQHDASASLNRIEEIARLLQEEEGL